MKLKLLICNLKENKTLPEILQYKKAMESCSFSDWKVVVCPQFPYLPIMHSKKYELGAQDVSIFPKGSYTGEVSAECLKSLDVKYVIIGHYEREMYFLENSDKLKQKINNALNQNLKIIIPVGESLMEYQLGKTVDVIIEKLNALLQNIPENKKSQIVIAYEPIWRVGKNLPLNKKEILSTIIEIKKWLHLHKYPNNKVIYGGGVTPEDMLRLREIDGFLLGNLSLNVEKICQIIENRQDSTNVYKN